MAANNKMARTNNNLARNNNNNNMDHNHNHNDYNYRNNNNNNLDNNNDNMDYNTTTYNSLDYNSSLGTNTQQMEKQCQRRRRPREVILYKRSIL